MTRRIASALTACAVVATLLVVIASPAMAQVRVHDFNNDHDDDFFFGGHRFFDRFGGFGDFGQGFDQEAESGDVNLSFETSNAGDNSNVCAPAVQFGNTGNLQNAQGFTTFGNGFFDNGFFDNGFFGNGDVDFEGSSMTFEPSLDTSCDQAVQQSSAASSD